MPKIVVKVNRSAHTRSKTVEAKKNSEPADKDVSPTKSKSRGPNPKKSTSKQEPRSSISRIPKKTVKLSDRNFFTVSDDNTILQYYNEFKNKLTSRVLAENLSKKVKHSTESIRDRIKRFLSRIRLPDERYIYEESKVGEGLSR